MAAAATAKNGYTQVLRMLMPGKVVVDRTTTMSRCGMLQVARVLEPAHSAAGAALLPRASWTCADVRATRTSPSPPQLGATAIGWQASRQRRDIVGTDPVDNDEQHCNTQACLRGLGAREKNNIECRAFPIVHSKTMYQWEGEFHAHQTTSTGPV